ncbi:MAG: TatD family hydrolase, partial [Elusimicrobia bacterium]|nr:TatD family hydrolase [Elusimicrobiota bacterium]
GLDYGRNTFSKDEQMMLLSEMLRLAGETDKPLVFHCRNSQKENAYADLFSVLKSSWKMPSGKKFSAVLHCFSGSEEDARTALDMGMALGVNATMGYPKNSVLREIVKKAGLKNILLETDCPYLPLQSERGKRNDPSKILQIAQALADATGEPSQKISEQTFQNCTELFSVKI